MIILTSMEMQLDNNKLLGVIEVRKLTSITLMRGKCKMKRYEKPDMEILTLNGQEIITSSLDLENSGSDNTVTMPDV